MRNVFGCTILSILIFSGCSDESTVEPLKEISYLKGQPVIVNLQQFHDGTKGDLYTLSGLPKNGVAYLVKGNFLVYEPKGTATDYVTINRITKGRSSTFNLSFSNDESACGIAVFDKKQIRKGESLVFDLIDNDKLCESPYSGNTAGIVFLNETTSHYFDLQPLTLPDISCNLVFNPPATFSGNAKVLYVVALGANFTTDFSRPDQVRVPSIEEILADPTKYYKHYLIGIAEVDVVDNR